MNYSKNYIGKGKQVKGLDIVRVSIPKEKLLEIMNQMVSYDTGEYLIFEVAKLKAPDTYGKTHTAYISTKLEEPAPKRRKTKKEA